MDRTTGDKLKALNETIRDVVLGEESLGTLAARSAFGGRVSGVTRKKIEAKHGKSVADAVQKHSERAFEHDNGQVSHGKSFHHEFVKKHLGGKGSQDHKDYKAYMSKAHHGEDNEGHFHHEETDYSQKKTNQLDELSPATKASYVKKAGRQLAAKAFKAARDKRQPGQKDKDGPAFADHVKDHPNHSTIAKREKGIDRATKSNRSWHITSSGLDAGHSRDTQKGRMGKSKRHLDAAKDKVSAAAKSVK